MLPRTGTRYGVALMIAVATMCAGLPARAAMSDSTQLTHIAVQPTVVPSTSGKVVTRLADRVTVKPFTLVAVTWRGTLEPGSRFRVRVRENGVWSAWTDLVQSADVASGSDGGSTASGTEPLLSALADGLSVKVESPSGLLPSGLEIVTSNAQEMPRDAAAIASPTSVGRAALNVPAQIVSTRGALVNRPRFVTRAQWGADESMRDQDPDIASGIIAGFIHHTATTNRYSASQGPAQMRNLYAYFTQGLKYRDMGYSFLVDKYGTVYEGRSGCPRDPVAAANCDGPSMPAIGGHTSGMNTKTFAVSVIGNYHAAKPTTAQVNLIVEAVAQTFAWKFAPYGVDPLGKVTVIAGPDQKGSARFAPGTTVSINTISGHRDVGQTVCPGKYLYPYLPRVRARVAELLTPAIGDATVSRTVQLVSDPTPVTAGMTVPAGSSWSITVRDVDGNTVGQSTGTTTETGPVSFDWSHVTATPALLPEGVYTASFDVTHGTSTLPTVTRTIALASVPQAPSGLSLRRRTSTSKTVSWNVVVNASPVSYSYRLIDTTAGVTRSWATTTARATSVRVSRLKARHRYRLEVTAGNALGTSPIASVQFVQ